MARCRQLSQAALELGLTQPALSGHLKRLEERYGTLYRRQRRGIVLTERGQQVLEVAREVFARLRSLEQLPGGELRGHLRLAASSLPAAFLLPQSLRSFQERHPDLQISLEVLPSQACWEGVREGRFEVAVAGDATAPAGRLKIHPWMTDQLGLYAHPDSPLHCQNLSLKQRLRACNLLLREAGSSTRTASFSLLRRYWNDFRSRLEVGSNEAIREHLLANLGVAIMSNLALRREVAGSALLQVDLPGSTRERTFWILEGQYSSEAQKTFVTHLGQCSSFCNL